MVEISYHNIKKAKAIEQSNKQRLLKINSNLNDKSGIYFLTREDENGIKHAYIGQAKHIHTRLAQHLVGFQYIDNSIKAHGLYSSDNIYGYKVGFLNFQESQLDEKEQYYIKQYALNGYQLKNRTAGSQGKGKTQIAEYKPSKGYHDGLKQGYCNASKYISHLFDLHLDYRPKRVENPTSNQIKAMGKFEDFLNICKGGNENG